MLLQHLVPCLDPMWPYLVFERTKFVAVMQKLAFSQAGSGPGPYFIFLSNPPFEQSIRLENYLSEQA